jgi:anti-sigma factor RsiW
MNCHDVQKSVHVYLDDEFAALERVEFEAHAKACSSCQALVARERRLLMTARTAPTVAPVPPAFEARIRALLAAEPIPAEWAARHGRRSRPSPSNAWFVAAAVLLVAAGALAVVALQGRDETERIADEALATHTRTPPLEVRGSSHHVRGYLEANVPFEVDLPFRESDEVQLVGARLTRVDGRDAVILHYRVDDAPLTVMQVASTDTARADVEAPTAAAEPRLRSENGFDIVTLRRKGIVSSFVGSGRDGRLPRLVQAAWRP